MKDGPAAGLATARVRPAYEGSVMDWCARDSIHEGPTRTVELDCLACGACCHDANVLLDEADFDRWRKAERRDLLDSGLRQALQRGKVTLRFLAGRPCRNLGEDNKCAIYEIRPDNCAAFVVGSEACLAAREDTLKLRDGLPEQDEDE